MFLKRTCTFAWTRTFAWTQNIYVNGITYLMLIEPIYVYVRAKCYGSINLIKYVTQLSIILIILINILFVRKCDFGGF